MGFPLHSTETETPTSEYILHYDRGLIVVHDCNAKSFLKKKTRVNAFYHGRAAALAQRAVVAVMMLS